MDFRAKAHLCCLFHGLHGTLTVATLRFCVEPSVANLSVTQNSILPGPEHKPQALAQAHLKRHLIYRISICFSTHLLATVFLSMLGLRGADLNILKVSE